MISKDIREKYLKFFESKGHKRIDPAPLVLENDPTTLFTSSGMQPLVPYLKGEQTHPSGVRLVNSQPSFRAEDIEEVGDNRHTTFFEMLGNWSLGDYFKKKQLPWIWEFLTKELGLPKEKLHVSIFEGNNQVPKDEETYETWKSLGLDDDHIHFYDAKKNWWSRSGPPENMAVGDIGGPDSEIFYDFGEEYGFHDKFADSDRDSDRVGPCHPNCDCGRFLEIGNSVFIQYKKLEDGTLEELPQKNVDFGGGLERLVAVTEDQPDIFKTDLFWPIVRSIDSLTGAKYEEHKEEIRVIADHMKAATFLIFSGVVPSNKLHGHTLRRLLRRSATKFYQLTKDMKFIPEMVNVYDTILSVYDGLFGITKEDDDVKDVKNANYKIIFEEMNKFGMTLANGFHMFDKIEKMDGKIAFDLYQSHGFPLEVTEELANLKRLEVNKDEFYAEFEKHKELSRTASAGMFRGGLASTGEQETKYHTATHLLHAALKKVLGDHVIQRGSNITAERMRFDFSHNEKLTNEQLREVESLVNEQIESGLPVIKEEMAKEDAEKSGAIGAFGQKYGERVKVYSIGNYSKEFCGGPHVTNTSEIGRVTITKEESAGTGIRRIYATIN